MKIIMKFLTMTGLAALFALLLVPQTAHAQAPAAMPYPGCVPNKILACNYTEPFGIEFEGRFQFDANMEDDGDGKQYNLMFGPALGVFLAKGFQIGFIPTLRLTKYTDGEDYTFVAGGAMLLLRYIIDTRSIVFPYFGALMGALGGKTDMGVLGENEYTILSVGPETGLKILVAGRAIVTLYLNYQFNSQGDDLDDDWTESHVINLGIGFGFWI